MSDSASPSLSPAFPIASPVAWPDAERRACFERWLADIAPPHGLQAETLRPASSDASFRRYLRIDGAHGDTFVVMDAPPPQEDVRPFIQIAALIERAGLNGVRVIEQDVANGFLLLNDLGSTLYLDALNDAVKAGDTARVMHLMGDATRALVTWQLHVDASGLPAYDDALLRRELALFPDWCVAREFGVEWNDAQRTQWQSACDLLVASALAQPVVAVHRDYMPRNLMVTDPNPGILDFQDAVRGPISYDVASLWRDAFISWDAEQELDGVVRYWQAARKAGLPVTDDIGEFWRQVEWMGLQRHLKVLGIFCRLKYRDGKPAYSADLPRFFGYAHRVATKYNGLGVLARLIEPLMGAERRSGYTF